MNIFLSCMSHNNLSYHETFKVNGRQCYRALKLTLLRGKSVSSHLETIVRHVYYVYRGDKRYELHIRKNFQ
jgi:hypothetical protein